MWFFSKLFTNKNVKKYGHIISLGYNCELSYQLFRHNRFVESNLFAWTYIYSAKDLLNALNNLNLIGENGFLPPNPLFECKNTHIRFHGNDKNPTQKDYDELSQRVFYLRDKFLKTLSDGETNLYMIKIRTDEDNIEQIISNVFEKLNNMVKNQFDLLVILENDARLAQRFEEIPNIYIRFVDFFAPDDDVTTKKCDKKNWKAIFDEFRPKYKLKKKKKFKFEEIAD